MQNVFVAGDFNIDLLKLFEKETFTECFDTMTENSFDPKCTLPTIFSRKCDTLIDKLYCKLTENTLDTTSGILIKIFSDHQLYFTFWNSIFNQNPEKCLININVQSPEAIRNLENELMASDIMNKLDISPLGDPNSNYTIIHYIIEQVEDI